jgi:hypothetical protein
MNFRHPDAQRAVRMYRFRLFELNIGHGWLMKEQANERLVAAVIETNPAANPEKVLGMVQAIWECE